MKILNFGSLNIDYVYGVDHFVEAAETTAAHSFRRGVGGKGLNQSVALAKAGASVYHAGLIGDDGVFLTDYLAGAGVDISCVGRTETATGHAIIQVDKSGQNCILIYGGANRCLTHEYIDAVLSRFERGDLVLMQNEVSEVGYIIEEAHSRGLGVIINPSPISDELSTYPLSSVDWFILNEIEGAAITGSSDENEIIKVMRERYPSARIILTLGERGSVYSDGEKTFFTPAEKASPVDTTAAGDTFTGYFFAGIAEGRSPEESAQRASHAAAITVTRPGAAESIPCASEI